MNEYWANFIERFKEVPIVDVFGVVISQDGQGWSSFENNKYPNEPDDIGLTGFTFDVWRIGANTVQTTRVLVHAIVSYKEWTSLVGVGGHLSARSPIHIKAKVAPNEAGFQQVFFVEWVGSTMQDAELNELRRQLTEPVILNAPPLPTLTLSYYGSWHGTIALPSWNNFYLQSEPHYRANRVDGFPLTMGSAPMPSERVGYRGIPPSPEEVATYLYLTENEQTIRDAVLQAILDVYPQWQEDYGGDAENIPDVTELGQFQSLLLLRGVSILRGAKEGDSAIYLDFDPNWDVEHGIGAVLHKDRVLAVGNHDLVSDVWGTYNIDATESES